MGIFSRLVSKKKKGEVEELFSDIREESKLFEEFLKLHEEKIELVKKIIPYWNTGQLVDIDKKVQEILSINIKLLGLANKILRISQKERALFYFIIKEKMNKIYPELEFRDKTILNRRKYSAYARGDLELYFIQLFDFLKSLSKLILRQINTINGWGKSASARFAKDLIEKENFYHLLFDEAVLDRKIKQYLILIIREINKLLGSEKKFGFEIRQVKIKGEDKTIATGVIFYELRDVYSRIFGKFYEFLDKSFHKDEVWPKYMVQEYLHYNTLKQNIKEGVARTNMIVGMVKDEVVAFTYFDTLYIKDPKGKNNICFGVNWWEAVAEGYRTMGISSKLYDYRKNVMERSAKLFGVKLDCILAEVDDPKKMTQQKIQEEIIKRGNNPFDRLKILEKTGMTQLKFDYVQPAHKTGKEVYHLMLMIEPFRKKWVLKGAIPLEEMERIWKCFIEFGYYPDPGDIEAYKSVMKTYKKVLQNIRQVATANKGFVPFG